MATCTINTVFDVMDSYRLLAAQPSLCDSPTVTTPYRMLYQVRPMCGMSPLVGPDHGSRACPAKQTSRSCVAFCVLSAAEAGVRAEVHDDDRDHDSHVPDGLLPEIHPTHPAQRVGGLGPRLYLVSLI